MALLVLCALLCACATEPYQSPLEQLQGAFAESEKPVNYRIILPSDATSELAIAVRAMAEKMAEKTQSEVTVRYEHEEDADKGEHTKVLIGWLEDNNSEMRELKKNDYLCKWSEDGAVVLGGRSEEATLCAIARFSEEILPAASKLTLMHTDAGFSFFDEYAVESFSFNGFDLQEYRIVFDGKEGSSMQLLARWLQDEIARQSGYYLSVVPKNAFDGNGRSFFLTVDAEQSAVGQASLLLGENGIVLCSDQVYGVSVAVRELAERLKESILSGVAAYEFSQNRILLYESVGADMAFLLAEDSLGDVDSIYSILDPILKGSENFFFINPVLEGDVHYLTENLKDFAIESSVYANGNALVGCQKNERAPKLVSAELLESGLSVSAWQMGTQDGGLRVLMVSGSIGQDTIVDLSSILDDSVLPTAIVVQVEKGDLSFEVADADTYGLDVLCNRVYQTDSDTEKIVFSVYADANMIRVESNFSNQSDGYCRIRMERMMAFALSEK